MTTRTRGPLVFVFALALAFPALAVVVPSTARADDPPEARRYVELEKSLYVWRLQTENRYVERLAAFCQRHGFTRVFLAIGSCQWDHANHYAKGQLPNEDRLATAIAALKAVGTEVHGMYVLNDGPDDLSQPERIVDLVTATHRYNERHPRAPITGLHGDQEPSDESVYAAYLRMNRLAAERRDELRAELALGVTLKPLWLRQSWTHPDGGDARPFVHHILDVVDEASLMDYSDDPATVLRLGNQALQYAKRVGKPMAIAVETGTKGAAPEETWGQEIERDGPLPFFGHLADFAAAFGRHGDVWDGLVVHDYFQYYRLLYGTDPIAHEAIPGLVFGNSPADAINADTPAPEALRGFAGSVKVTIARLGDGWAVVQLTRVRRESRDSTAADARDAEDAFLALHAGGAASDDDGGDGDGVNLHALWLQTVATGDDETLSIRVDGDGRAVIAELSSRQRRAAERAARDR